MSQFSLARTLGVHFIPRHRGNGAEGRMATSRLRNRTHIFRGSKEKEGKTDGKPQILLAGCSGWNMNMGFVAVPSQEMGIRV